MIGSNKKEGWPECFQDLGNWCPLAQDELHTPKVNIQDEFNFSIDDGQSNDWDILSSPVDMQCDLWGNDTKFGITPYQPLIGDINNTTVQERSTTSVINNNNNNNINKTPNNIIGNGDKVLYTFTTDSLNDKITSPLIKSKGNVLLSQGIVKTASDDSTLLSMTPAFENETNNNPVLISSNCYLLPVSVPEFASAKLNSSSLSTYLTSSSQLQSSLSTTTTNTPPQQQPQQISIQTNKEISKLKVEKKLRSTALTQHQQEQQQQQQQQQLATARLEKVTTASLKEQRQQKIVKDSLKKIRKIVKPDSPLSYININNNDVEMTRIYRKDKQQAKPLLKLNIGAANSASSKVTSSLNTPEVLKPLVDADDSKEFNLLQYVCNDGDFPGFSQEEVKPEDDRGGDAGEHVIRDHDYTADSSWPIIDIKTDFVIKSEPGSPTCSSYSASNASTSKAPGKRKRRRDSSSDYVLSESDITLSDDDDDDSQEWNSRSTSLSSNNKKKKKQRSKTSLNNTTKNKAKIRKSATNSGRRISSNSQQSEQLESGGQDKYRELRERNNEASRRSRMNRKQRDVQMLVKAEELHKKNVYLKARAEKMENLVKYMRAEIMKALTKPK